MHLKLHLSQKGQGGPRGVAAVQAVGVLRAQEVPAGPGWDPARVLCKSPRCVLSSAGLGPARPEGGAFSG